MEVLINWGFLVTWIALLVLPIIVGIALVCLAHDFIMLIADLKK